jgi:hypothetical protein
MRILWTNSLHLDCESLTQQTVKRTYHPHSRHLTAGRMRPTDHQLVIPELHHEDGYEALLDGAECYQLHPVGSRLGGPPSRLR